MRNLNECNHNFCTCSASKLNNLAKGVDSPDVYFITHRMTNDEIVSNKYPMSGDSGVYLYNLLSAYGLLATSRIVALKRCISDKDPESYGCCMRSVLQDIVASSPKVIVGLGATVCQMFLGNKFTTITSLSGSVHKIQISGVQYSFVPLFSPEYILNNLSNTQLVDQFSSHIAKIAQISTGTYKDVLEDKVISWADSYDSLVQFYNEYLTEDKTEKLAYDIETNAKPPMDINARIIGFSLASSQGKGVYTCIDSLEYTMSEEDQSKCLEFLTSVLKSRKVIVHNSMYERPYTLARLGYELSLEQTDDTLVMARLMLGGKTGAGLKPQAQLNLGYPDWETDLTIYLKNYRSYISRLWSLASCKDIVDKIMDGSDPVYTSMINIYNDMKADESRGHNAIYGKKICEEFMDYWEKINDVLLRHYTEEEIIRVISPCMITRMKELFEIGEVPSVLPYNYIPKKILCDYGAVDALATYDLYDYYADLMTRKSTETVDLFKGYEVWLEHSFVGYIMERNGAYWDEDQVSKDEATLTQNSVSALKNMLLSPLMKDKLADIALDYYKPQLLSDYFPEIALDQGYMVEYDRSTGKYNIFSADTHKRVRKDYLNSIVIPPYRISEIKSFAYEKICKFLTEEAKSIEDIKPIYNPSSTLSRDIPKAVLVTDQMKFGNLINKLSIMANSPDYSEEILQKMPQVVSDMFKLVLKITNTKELKSEYGDNWLTKKRELYNSFVEMMYKDIVKISKYVVMPEPLSISTYDDETIIEIFNSYVSTGIDPDDESTWNEQFKWLINYRIFKKTSKIITSYIKGKVGRASVAIVDKESMSRGDKVVYRKDWMSNRKANEDEDYIVASSFGVNTVQTGRWKSGFHTLPWQSPVKRYYGSRYKGGTIFCLSGDTEVLTGYGERIKIADLASRNFAPPVVSYDTQSGIFKIAKSRNPRMTKQVNDLVRVTFSNGKYIECTPDHRFLSMMADQYVEAIDLDNPSTNKVTALYKMSADHASYWMNTGRIFEAMIDLNLHITEDTWDSNLEIVANHRNSRGEEILEYKDYSKYKIKELIKRGNSFGEVVDRLSDAMSVIKVEPIHYDDPVPVYDITVDEYSNFTVMISPTEGVVVHNCPDYCLSGDTLIPLADGSVKPISSLTSESEFSVYSYDINTGKYVVGHAHDCRLVRTSATMYSITLDTGEVIRCTPEHKFLTNDYEYTQAMDLDYNSKIIGIYSKSPIDESIATQSRIRKSFNTRGDRQTLSMILKLYNRLIDENISWNSFKEWDQVIERLENRSTSFNRLKRYSDTLKKYFSSKLELEQFMRVEYKIVDIQIDKSAYEDTYCFTVDDYHNFVLANGVVSSNSQMEVRTLASASQEDTMIKAFLDGADIHKLNAAKIWNKPIEDVTDAERRFSKMGCNLGTTKIPLMDGTIESIENLYNTRRDQFYVYSFDRSVNRVVPGKCVGVDLTKYVTDTVRITFDNGAIWEGTPDHKFLCIDGTYVTAEQLTESDTIESLFTRIPTKGAYCFSNRNPNYYQQVRQTHYEYKGRGATRYGKWYPTHIMSYESLNDPVGKGYQVDHIDHNTLNNSPDNLRKLTDSENRINIRYRSDSDKYAILAQAVNIARVILDHGEELNSTTYDKYRPRNRVYASTVLKYYSWDYIKDEASKPRVIPDLTDPIENNKIKLTQIAGRTISKIEHIHYDDPIPVYDIAVETYHNYAIDLGDHSGVFTHNTFSLLYGGTEEGFANNFLHGDLARAHEIYGGFFAAYPKIKTWVAERQKEGVTNGEVSVLTGRFIKLRDDISYGSKLRQSMNYPIQGGCISSDTRIKMSDGSYKTIPELMDEYGSNGEFEVYAYDVSSHKIVKALARNAHMTKISSEITTVRLSNDKSVRCTPDHPFMISDGSYRRADELSPDTVLMSDDSSDEVKVISVNTEFSSDPVYDVYDITVPGYDNFVLESGVVIHNSSDIVGCVIYSIQKYIDDHGYSSKIFLFVHDSIEIDVPPYELLSLMANVQIILNKVPMERFNTPSKADVALGKSLGHEIDMKSIKSNDDYTEALIVLSGFRDEMMDTLNEWKKAYKTVMILEEDFEDVYISINELFIVKKAYSMWVGKHRQEGKMTLFISYYNEVSEDEVRARYGLIHEDDSSNSTEAEDEEDLQSVIEVNAPEFEDPDFTTNIDDTSDE